MALTAPSLSDAMAEALALHRSGDLRAAVRYRRILELEPGYADALHLLGLTALQGSDAATADRWVRRAIQLDGQQAIYRNSLGETLRVQGDLPAALAQFRTATLLNPAYPDAYANLLKSQSGPQGGRTPWLRYCRLRTPSAPDLQPLAEGLLRRGACELAAEVYGAAVMLDPGQAQLYVNLGAAFSGAKRYADAAKAYRRATLISPDHPGAWNNLASAHWEMHDPAAAVDFCRRSIALKPDHPDAYSNLSYITRCLAQSDADFAAAERLCRQALRLNPSHVPALNNLGILQLDRGQLAESETAFRRVLWAQPGHPDGQFNLGLVLLKAGRLEEAWEPYEARWQTGQLPVPDLGGRRWQGQPLHGEQVLIYAEQGHGDTLHFVRYAPMVAQRGGRVVLAVQPALKRLLAGMPGIHAVYAMGEPVPVGEFTCPMMSLPGVFGTSLTTIPAPLPYLFPPADAIEAWAARPLPAGRLRVGLVWSGDPRPGLLRAHLTDRRRSMQLQDLAPLAGIPGVTFVNLQLGSARDQLATPPEGMTLFDPMTEVRDFADTAALVQRLDLVITVDTSVAHLVGAVGKPVWVLSRFDGCWRWLTEGSQTPWYPTMRLYRQTAAGDWATPMVRVAADLRRLAGAG